MEVRKNKRSRTKKRGLDRWVVSTHKEFKAGLLDKRELKIELIFSHLI